MELKCLNEINIIDFIIDKFYQKMGFGRVLMSKYLNTLPSNSEVFLEVKKSNLRALNLYKYSNFVSISERKNYYGSNEDAIIMKYSNFVK